MKYERQSQSFSNLSDDELLQRLSELLQKSRRVESELVAHIGEVDARRLYAREAAPSMFAYCTEVLNLSEHEAYLRIGAARASRRHPILLQMLAEGRLHLSAIARLGPHLTEANRDGVLARAVGKSMKEIEELIAELAPKPDVPAKIRKLPERRDQVEAPTLELVSKRVTNLHTATARPQAPAQRPLVQPLAPARYKVQFTASAEFRDKLERLRSLMRSSVPDGDLAAIIDEAVTEKIERLHHKDPYGRGGEQSVDNLQLMCRAHNGYLAEQDYGKELIARHRRASHVSEPGPVWFDAPAHELEPQLMS